MTLLRSPLRPVLRSPLYSPLVGKWGGGFTPLVLFANSGKGAWYDPSDISTLSQDSAGTTPVTADGDSVGRMLDKSGNNNHWTQATGGQRPVYKTSGGLSWLKYDGLDDNLGKATISLASGMSAFAAIDRVTDATWLMGYDVSVPANRYFGVAQVSASVSYGLSVGSPSMRVNAASIGTTRQNLLDAFPANTPAVFTAESLDMSAWVNLAFGAYSAVEFGGRLFGFIVAPNASAANRTATEQYLARKAGITF